MQQQFSLPYSSISLTSFHFFPLPPLRILSLLLLVKLNPSFDTDLKLECITSLLVNRLLSSYALECQCCCTLPPCLSQPVENVLKLMMVPDYLHVFVFPYIASLLTNSVFLKDVSIVKLKIRLKRL